MLQHPQRRSGNALAYYHSNMSQFIDRHPFVPDLSDLSIDELQEKISDLNKRLTYAYHIGNRPMINQLNMLLSTYRTTYQGKVDEQMKKMQDLIKEQQKRQERFNKPKDV
jgi:hypothetical protein